MTEEKGAHGRLSLVKASEPSHLPRREQARAAQSLTALAPGPKWPRTRQLPALHRLIVPAAGP